MAEYDGSFVPRLRYVEAHPVELDGASQMGGPSFLLSDPTGLAANSITVSGPALFIISQFDGTNTLDAVRDAFAARFGQPIGSEQLVELVNGLRQARFLAGEEFEAYYAGLVAEYRAAPTRVMRSAADLGLEVDTGRVLDEMLAAAPTEDLPAGRVVGLVAPHLDYPRGRECYSAAYSVLRERRCPERVVILGTNHFGRSTSVVATGKDFETPLGVTACDTAFIEALEARCGDLRREEYDHAREHSIELQLLICQHIWGAGAFRMAAVLCPDPCGPTGTAPIDGDGVDLRAFAAALHEVVAGDETDTLVIAGADLSHIGPQFGDDRVIDDTFRSEVKMRDGEALLHLGENQPEDFVAKVAREQNPTRVCSAGCIATAMWTLPDADVRVLRYHQAVDEAGHVGVTCAAAVFLA
ncbi:MAG: AmmeMemoRadiSam system protein B [Phycisphaerales bacterium]|nr:AmmeMemoRadiSam system protein B [Phycisphaerales bacterium]